MSKLTVKLGGKEVFLNDTPYGIVQANVEFRKAGVEKINSTKDALRDFLMTGSIDVELILKVFYSLYRGASNSQRKPFFDFVELVTEEFIEENVNAVVINSFGQDFYDEFISPTATPTEKTEVGK
jgi:hypothetical protein